MIRKEFLIGLSISALLLGGCVDSSTGAAAKADMEGGEAKHKTEVKKEAPKAEEKKVEAPKKEEAKAPATKEKKAEEPKKEEAKTPATEEKKAEEPKKEETKAPATEEKKAEESKKEEAKAPATEEKKAEESKSVNTTACVGCHGANFEKKAMGVSRVVKDLPKDEIVKALKGYKDGSYGGSMKSIMKAQTATLDDKTIEAIANKIGK